MVRDARRRAPHHEGLALARLELARRIGRRHGGGAADGARRTWRAACGWTRRSAWRRRLARCGRGVAKTAEEILERRRRILRRPRRLLLLLDLSGLARLPRLSESGLTGLQRRTLLRLLPLSGLHDRSVGRDACHRRIALGLFAADFAARPGKIVGASGGRRERLALHQRSRGEPIDGCGSRA